MIAPEQALAVSMVALLALIFIAELALARAVAAHRYIRWHPLRVVRSSGGARRP